MDRRPPRGCGSGHASKRKHDMEGAAGAHSTLHPDAAPMLLHDALADKEAETHARKAAVVDVRGAVKALEYLGKVGGRDPDPLVGNVDQRLATTLRDYDADLAVFRAVFHSVLHEIFEHLT